jgi:hypothetical protein
MKVKNLNGTSDNPNCPCGSWIKHWKNHIGVPNPACFWDDCNGQGTDGAHVQKCNGDMSWYIIPLCKEHNGQHGATFEIYNNYESLMVPVTERSKCKRN